MPVSVTQTPSHSSACATHISREVGAIVARRVRRSTARQPSRTSVFVHGAGDRWSTLSEQEQRLLMLLDSHANAEGHALIQRAYASRVLDTASIDALLDRLFEARLLMVVRLDAGRKLGGTWLVCTPRASASTLHILDLRREIAARIAEGLIARQQEAAA